MGSVILLFANGAFPLSGSYSWFAGLLHKMFGTLEHDFGIEIAHADEEVDATAADPRLAELFGVPRGTPLLRIRQVIYSTKGKATMYVLGFYRSDRHTLLIRRFRSPVSHKLF